MKLKRILSVIITVAMMLQSVVLVSAQEAQQKQGDLSNSLYKLRTGDEFTIAYYGGSITYGAGSTDEKNGYAHRVQKAIEEKYGREGLDFSKSFNAAISGTGTYYGTYRADKDLWLGTEKTPDLIFIEFAINDLYEQIGTSNAKKYMESIVRKCYKANPNMDIIIIYTTDRDVLDGANRYETAHKEVAAHYGIPELDVGLAIMHQIRVVDGEDYEDYEGKAIWKKYFADWVHPSDAGHQVYCDNIMKYIDAQWGESVPTPAAPVPMTLGASTFGSVDDAYLLGVPKSYDPVGGQFEANYQGGNGYKTERWRGDTDQIRITEPYQTFAFKFNGTDVSARYDLGYLTSSGSVTWYPQTYGNIKVIVDGVPSLVRVYNSSKILPLVKNLEPGEHTVVLVTREDTLGGNPELKINGFGIVGDPTGAGISILDCGGDPTKLPEVMIDVDKTSFNSNEEVKVTAQVVNSVNTVVDTSITVDGKRCENIVDEGNGVYTTTVKNLDYGEHVVSFVATDIYGNRGIENITILSRNSQLVLGPSVIINAGENAIPNKNISKHRIGLVPYAYNVPNPPKEAAYVKVALPELFGKAEIKKVVMLASSYFPDQMSGGKTRGEIQIYDMTENIESNYTYSAKDKANNLRTLVGDELKFSGKMNYTPGENYSPVAIDTHEYDLNLDITDYILNFYKDTNNPGEKSFRITATDAGLAIKAGDDGVKSDGMNNPICFLFEIYEPLDAYFSTNSFAYPGDGFGIAVKVNKDNITGVEFAVGGNSYTAAQNEAGEWYTFVEEGLEAGNYEIVANVTDDAGNVAQVYQPFTVAAKEYEFVKTSIAYKHQSSDGKMWSVSATDNYNLLYSGGEIKDVLYSGIDISDIQNFDAIESISLVGSTKSNGANGWTKFSIDACDDFTAASIRNSDGTPNVLPTIGENIVAGTYPQLAVKADHADFALLSENIVVSDGNTGANYMSADVTEYVKALREAGKKNMFFRTSLVSHNGTETYGFTVNNTTYRLLIKYKQPGVINNHDGTVTYIVKSQDYKQDGEVLVTVADYDTEGALNGIQYFEALTGRKAFRIAKGGQTKLFIWDGVSNIEPLKAAQIIR